MKLESHPFFGSLSGEQLSILTHATEEAVYEDEAIIFEEGDPSDSIYLVLEGVVTFFVRREEDNNQQEVNTAKAGEYFGEIGVLTKEKRSLSAKATGNVRLARLPALTLNSMLTVADDPLSNILNSVIRHLQSTTRHYITEIEKQEKLALVGMMMSSVLHDFRNPFNLINMATHLIRNKAANGDEVDRFCKTIEVQLERMTSMMNDIISFSSGSETLDPVILDLRSLSEQLRENCAHLAAKLNIILRIEFEEGEFIGDNTKILRALGNLISNAVDVLLTPPRKGGEVIVKAWTEEGSIIFTVADNGPGIPEAIIDRFFEPFVTHNKRGGTGLGSAITKSIVDAHQGTIDFKSVKDKGTTFTIRLPESMQHAMLLEE